MTKAVQAFARWTTTSPNDKTPAMSLEKQIDQQRRHPRVLYACFERIVPGSAAATHVIEICDGLRALDWTVSLMGEHGTKRGGVVGQLARYGKVTWRALVRLPSHDIVYVRSHFAGLPLALAARLLGRTVVQEVNGVYGEAFVTHPHFQRLHRLLSWAQRLQYRWASAIIAVTPQLTVWAAGEGGHNRTYHVGNAANTELFRPDGCKAERSKPFALFFGGMTRWHGVEVLLSAARLPEWPDELDLVVAGPVVDVRLNDLFRDLPSRVTWLNGVPQSDIPALLRAAAVALVPTLDPNGITEFGITPLKLFEMMACGTPVVVSDYRGMADLVRQGPCGLVVPPGDARALASAVAYLTRNPDLARQMGEAGAKLVASDHSWHSRANETATIIKRVLADAEK